VTHRPQVRIARDGDDTALRRLDRRTWSSTTSPAPPPDGETFFAESRRPADHLVAELDGRLGGYIGLGHPTPLVSNRHVSSITGLAVDPQLQGHGIGRVLVEAAVAEARRRGAPKLALRVLCHNAAARRLYRTCGFVVEGVLHDEFLLDGSYVDDILMARHLTSDGDV
jgi:ribosomal protein S18 acetylase RimI-like enzyme